MWPKDAVGETRSQQTIGPALMSIHVETSWPGSRTCHPDTMPRSVRWIASVAHVYGSMQTLLPLGGVYTTCSRNIASETCNICIPAASSTIRVRTQPCSTTTSVYTSSSFRVDNFGAERRSRAASTGTTLPVGMQSTNSHTDFAGTSTRHFPASPLA